MHAVPAFLWMYLDINGNNYLSKKRKTFRQKLKKIENTPIFNNK